MKGFLDANADEVVTMLLTNGDNVNVTEFDSIFGASGITEYAFVPATSPGMLAVGDWPTYAELIAQGKRLVMFLDYGANEAVVPYILDEVRHIQPDLPSSRPMVYIDTILILLLLR